MNVNLVSVDKYGDCNFCNRKQDQVERPYEYIFEFIKDNGNGLKASICYDCILELKSAAFRLRSAYDNNISVEELDDKTKDIKVIKS